MKRFKIVFVIFAILSLIILPVSAYYKTWEYGSAYRVVGIKNDLSSTYSSALTDAIESWNDGLTKRELRITSGAVNSIIDVDFFDGDDIPGLSFLYPERLISSGYYKAWSYNTTTCCSNHQTISFMIYVNTYLCPSTSISTFKQAVICHELGHALGLDDFTNYYNYTDHIMNYATNNDSYYTPNASEITGVNTYWNH